MSAQRRTATKTPASSPPREADGAPAAAARVDPRPPKPAKVDPRPPKPVVSERRDEPKSGVAARLDDLKAWYWATVAEIKKVNWPDRETTRNLTVVVIAMTIALGLLLGGIDFLLQTLFRVL